MKYLIRLLIVFVVLYVLLNIGVLLYDYYLDIQLTKFDLNQDGFFNGDEITVEQKEMVRKVTSDTARNLAPITLIPKSIVLGIALLGIHRIYLSIKNKKKD